MRSTREAKAHDVGHQDHRRRGRAYAVDNRLPPAVTLPAIKAVIDPIFFNAMPLIDGWSNVIRADSTPNSYTIYSQGKDGIGATCSPGTTSAFDDEICYSRRTVPTIPRGTQH